MEAAYHQQVLERAIGARVSRRALAEIIAANLSQDSLLGLMRPELHFDNNLIDRSLAYIEAMRVVAASTETAARAWEAFGRLSHSAQDFYSHSNYVALWLEQYEPGAWPEPRTIDGLDARLLRHPRLRTSRIYLPLEALCVIPALRGTVKRFLPRDAHAWVNLDSPAAGPLFPYSLEAAVQRTVAEFDRTLAAIGEAGNQAAIAGFIDM